MANRAVFEVAYEGPAVDDGIMDVRELAPALLALGSLIESANQVIGDPEAQVKVAVHASFEKGSFQISLELIYKLSSQIKFLLDFQTAHNLAEKLLAGIGFISGTGICLIDLIQWIRGRKIKSAVILDNNNVRLELPADHNQYEYIEVNKDVIRLYSDRSVREKLRQVLSPLERDGINSFTTRRGKDVIKKISKEDVPHFDIPDEPEEQQSTIFSRKAFVNLVEVAFEEGLKWRFSDGENKFYATIEDEEFLKEMELGKKFAKGDILEVELETRQTATSKGIKNEHKVLKVINHITKPQQLSLPFDTDVNKED